MLLEDRRLLVVDADPTVHELLAGALERTGQAVQNAYDNREALVQVKKSPWDVVVADQGRNGFDSFKLMRRVHALAPNARVILTGDASPARVLDAIRGRAFSYFHKPLAGALLTDMVLQALAADSWKDEIRLVSARPDWITLDVRCKLSAAERTTQFFREMQTDLPEAIRDDVAVAIRELLMNGIEHGGKSDPRKRVRAALLRTSKAVIGHVHDPGTGFSLDFLPHAAISNPEDSPIKHVEVRLEQGQRPGGFGILMARNLVDDLIYNERGNAVLFVKYLK